MSESLGFVSPRDSVMCLPLRWSPSLTCSSLPANRLTPSPARMVVFHSPVQRQRRAPFSASPAPPGPLDEDPDNIFNATPGPARARSVLEGTSASKGAGGSSSHVKPSGKSIDNLMPASANLQQRLQQSLMLVADSPSSKLNAPDPFRPRNQLRRSPPVAMKAFDHHNVDGNKQSDDATRTPEQHTVLLMDEPVPQLSVRDLSVPSPAKKQRPRSFELAAKALFDNRKPDKGQPAAFLTPQASTSSHRRKLSLPTDDIRRSAPMRQSNSNTSLNSAASGGLAAASPGTLRKNATPVRALAKIGRLTARNADLEAKLKSASSELDSILRTHQALQEEYDFIKREKEAALKRVEEYEEIAIQCEELIESHERLQSANSEMEQQRQTDIIELETVKEAMGKLKWKERKLRHELHIRREEGIYKEYESQNEHLNPTLRELRIENCDLKVSIADLKEKVSVLEYEKTIQTRSLQAAQQDLVWYEEVTKTHQDDLSTLQKRVDKRTRVIAELEDEQRQLSERLTEEMEENDQLKSKLEDAQQRISALEQQNEQGREAQNEYIGSQTAVRRLEKQVKTLETQLADRTLKLEKKIQILQTAIEDKETKLDQATVLHQNLFKKSEEQLKQSQQDLRSAELKLRQVEKERDQLKSSWDMHRRASRVFGDGPNQTEAEAGIGSALPPLTEPENHINGSKLVASPLGKRKRDKRKAVSQPLDSDGEEDVTDDADSAVSEAPPAPSRTVKPAKEGNKKTSLKNAKESKKQVRKPVLDSDSDDDDDAKTRPAKRKKQSKPKEGTIPDEEVTSASENEVSLKQGKRKRRRTAIKSGVPEQFRKKLKEEADNRKQKQKKKEKQQSRIPSESESESSESTSEESDSVKVASSPRNSSTTIKNGTSSKSAKTPAQLSQSGKTATTGKTTKPVVKTEKTANTSNKSASSTSGSSLGTKKKITLHKSASSNFIWGSGSAGASQSAISKGLLDLPDILSPVVKR